MIKDDVIKTIEKSPVEPFMTSYSKLYVENGATPMTIADLITREVHDRDFLESVVYFINAYIEHEL